MRILSHAGLGILIKIHIEDRSIWISRFTNFKLRHGESVFNVQDRIGGDPLLTERGVRYSIALAEFIKSNSKRPEGIPKGEEWLGVWTSNLRRAMFIADLFDDSETTVCNFKILNEIYAGDFDSMTFKDFEQNHPIEWDERQKNKLIWRYPGAGGESYLVIQF